MKKIGIVLVLSMSILQLTATKKQQNNTPIQGLSRYTKKDKQDCVTHYTPEELERGGKIYRDIQRINRCEELMLSMLYKTKNLVVGAACIHAVQLVIQVYVSK